jgi:Reverse transcriptase (RNA-dependent DNA polymerase)
MILNKPLELGMVDLILFFSNNFARGQNDTTLFTKKKGNYLLLVQVYVDYIIFGLTNSALVEEFSSLMGSEFEMSMMRELIFSLGLQIKQMKDDIFISQTKYVKEFVKKFGLDNCKRSKTSMAIDTNLGVDEGGRSTDIHQYRAMIDSFLYLTASRPDIMFCVYLCARYQANPKESHLIALKIILKYVKSTLNLGL